MLLSITIKLFEVVFPVFFVIGIGYWFGKNNPRFDTNVITNFVGKIGVPCLLFYSLVSTSLDFNTFIKFGGITFLFVSLFAIPGIIVLKLIKRDSITELGPLILPNCGNIGLPLAIFAYGSNGFAIGGSIASVIMLLHFTLGIFLASKKLSLGPLLKSVPMYVIFLSAFLLYFKIEAPQFLINTTMLIGYAAIFLVLASLGIALSTLKTKNIYETSILSAFRLLVGPIVGFLIIDYFNLKSYEAGIILIQCSMPSAILNFLLAKMYSKKIHATNIASVIMTSTALSFITIPIIVLIALTYYS